MFFPQVPLGEIDTMINTVDRNKDGKISYSEFRWVLVLTIVLGVVSIVQRVVTIVLGVVTLVQSVVTIVLGVVTKVQRVVTIVQGYENGSEGCKSSSNAQ